MEENTSLHDEMRRQLEYNGGLCDRSTLKNWIDRIEREYVPVEEIVSWIDDGIRHAWRNDGMADHTRDTIERYYLPRPSFDDGDPVQFGDRFVGDAPSKGGTIDSIKVWKAGGVRIMGAHGEKSDSFNGTFRREPMQVLAADGLPIKVGETLWMPNGRSMHVDRINDGFPETDSYGVGGVFVWSEMTHTPPDSQERIDVDAKKDACDYFGRPGLKSCDGCPANGEVITLSSCMRMQTLDLLRRQRELDKAGEQA